MLAVTAIDVLVLLVLPMSGIWPALTSGPTAATLVLAVLAARAADGLVRLVLISVDRVAVEANCSGRWAPDVAFVLGSSLR